ncbi:MAG: tRNA epoxyqueuosine(34) reductase QueG [Bacilli bacterium]
MIVQADSYEISFAELEAIGREAAVEAIGVADAEPFHDLMPLLRRYYAEGRSSGFEHPLGEQRVDPGALLPGAQSIVSIAVPYRTRQTVAMRRPKGRRGMVSAYAWGRDYHPVLKEKLRMVADLLERACGRAIRSLPCVDTAPLVDRAVAERAGIGFVGKNCMVITKEYGSWVFLGALLTDVRIEPQSSPMSMDSCGDCDLCLTACPTGALREPFVLDSQSCLSYLTQSKGMIAEEYRAALGRRVWGCDTCQTVCPKNHVSLLGEEAAFTPDPELSFPDLKRILTLSGRAFMREFGHTAAAWRGFSVWRRNAVIALGNMRDLEALPLLLPLLSDPRPEIRASAAWALSRIDIHGASAPPTNGKKMRLRRFSGMADASVGDAVRAAYGDEHDEAVRREMEWAAPPKP